MTTMLFDRFNTGLEGATKSMPITKPRDLDIPKKMNEVMADLNDQGQAMFNAEIVAALSEAKESNDLGPVQFVVNAWYVSRRFLTHADIDRALEASVDIEGSNLYTAEELGTRLGVA